MRKEFDVPAAAAKQALVLYEVRRWSPQQIATWLNERGVPGPSRKGKWGPQAVRRFIIAPAQPPPSKLVAEQVVLPKPVRIARKKL